MLGYCTGLEGPGRGATTLRRSRKACAALGSASSAPMDAGEGGLGMVKVLRAIHTGPSTSSADTMADRDSDELAACGPADAGSTIVVQVGTLVAKVALSPGTVIVTRPPASKAKMRYSPGAMLMLRFLAPAPLPLSKTLGASTPGE